mmetsp:Transcript_29337/g.49346  ORF Transcript_29337/g.49346 Transcript_29337/m.49346 type:complete len:91 (-) Transcript_29337:90-362(-)
MYFNDWEEFYAASEQLLLQNPTKTRYLFKYRHKDEKLVLKVTDDKKCFKFKTDQQADAKKLDRLNNLFFSVSTNRPIAPSESGLSSSSSK